MLQPSPFATDQAHGILRARVTMHHTEGLKLEECYVTLEKPEIQNFSETLV